MQTTDLVRTIAHGRRLCVGVTYDPTADEGERWTATVGLDASGAARTPELAIGLALLDLDGDLGSRGSGPLSRLLETAADAYARVDSYDDLLERADAAYERNRDLYR